MSQPQEPRRRPSGLTMFEVGILLLLVVAGGWFIWGRMRTAQETSVRASAKAQLEELGVRYETGESETTVFLSKSPYPGPAIVYQHEKIEGHMDPGAVDLIALFPEVRCLALEWSGIDDEELGRLSKFKDLQYLSLSGSLVTDEGLAVLREFPDLRELDLSYSRVKGPGLAHLRSLTKLETLHLRTNELTDDCVSALLEIPSLKRVSLDRTFLSSRLGEIRDAGIEEAEGSGPPRYEFAWLSPYRDGGFMTAPILRTTPTESTQAAWDTIRRLAVAADSQIELLAPPDGRVTCLRIRGGRMKVEHFQAMTQMRDLQSLDLAVSRFPAEFLSQLDSLSELRRIDLSRTEAASDLRTVAPWLSRIESLHLRDANLTGEELKGLSKRVPALRILDLSGNPLSGDAVRFLAECSLLEELSLARTKVSAGDPAPLSKVASLRRLDLRGTGIGEADVQALKKKRPDLKILVDSSGPSE